MEIIAIIDVSVHFDGQTLSGTSWRSYLNQAQPDADSMSIPDSALFALTNVIGQSAFRSRWTASHKINCLLSFARKQQFSTQPWNISLTTAPYGQGNWKDAIQIDLPISWISTNGSKHSASI